MSKGVAELTILKTRIQDTSMYLELRFSIYEKLEFDYMAVMNCFVSFLLTKSKFRKIVDVNCRIKGSWPTEGEVGWVVGGERGVRVEGRGCVGARRGEVVGGWGVAGGAAGRGGGVGGWAEREGRSLECGRSGGSGSGGWGVSRGAGGGCGGWRWWEDWGVGRRAGMVGAGGEVGAGGGGLP